MQEAQQIQQLSEAFERMNRSVGRLYGADGAEFQRRRSAAEDAFTRILEHSLPEGLHRQQMVNLKREIEALTHVYA
jgi:hypothetical protein